MRLSKRMKLREKQADITNGVDSPFMTMDRRVWLDYAAEVFQLEAKPEHHNLLKSLSTPFVELPWYYAYWWGVGSGVFVVLIIVILALIN